MKPVMVLILLVIAVCLLLGCQATVTVSSPATDTPSPIPILPPLPTATATETPRPPETATPSGAPESPSAVAPTPLAGWQAYTTFGLTFACPADWQVSLPRAADWDHGPGISLRAPAAAYPGGNVFSLSWRYFDIADGQSLREWAQQVFLADRDTMIPPRTLLALVDLPPVEPGGQALLTTELAGPGQGFYRQHVYLTHGRRVLDLTANTTPAESPAAAQILRAIAATMRFTAPPPAHDPAFGQPGLATVVAQATAFARAAATPSCDLVCRDATVMARVTPGPSVTYPPAMATQEKQYYDRLATATARALTTTPTPTPSATPTATAQPGLVRYAGRYPYVGEAPLGTPAPSYVFQLAYAPTVWRFEGNDRVAVLTYRALPSCQLTVQNIGEWGGPVVVDRSSLAGLDWSTAYWIADGAVVYRPQVSQRGPWFAVRAGAEAPAAAVAACRQAAEEVLNTFSMRP